MPDQNDIEGGDDELVGHDTHDADDRLWVHCEGCDKYSVPYESDRHAISKEQTHKMIDCPNCGVMVYETGLRPLSELPFDPTVEPEFEIEFTDEAKEVLGITDDEKDDETEEN